ncbi:MAG TPA: oxidoreductase [Thermotoga sp.]|uniref:complex I subunit 5 family protein n=1 Tax=Thermotoga sp. (strain RQ2) TaxID=126740 RepID=UPI0001600BED|nr:complex I subunit 5 family protein [Thermotoga sp. RQ2]ACB09943.1 NADH/Ubiquinone/plastoquinone (complex I) [Thermotoga sp. RQ2]HBF69303.1 oxidoreductase [Thermotoga sp.]
MISLLVAVPLLAAFVSLFWKKASDVLFSLVALFNVIVVLSKWFPGVVEIHAMGNWKPPFGINLVLDDASFYAALIVNLIFLMVSFLPVETKKGYETSLMLLLGATNGFVLTGDLFNSFVFMEIITITAVTIAAKRENFYNAYKYLILGGIAGSFYLLATIFAYGATGSLNMAHIAMVGLSGSSLLAVTMLYTIGFGVEAKLFPLNGWVPGVYGGNEISPIVLGTAVSFAALYMLGRLFGTVFHGSGLNTLYVLSLVTILTGEMAALRESRLLRTFAYSSVAQAGVVAAMISKGTENALNLAYFHLTNDVIAKFVIFLVAGFLVYSYRDLNGVFRKHKLLGISFSMATFSLVGFPMFAGFQSKIRMIMEAFSTKDFLFPAVLLIATAIEVGYVIKWNVRLWFEEETFEERSKVSLTIGFFSFALAILLVVVFLQPDVFLEGTQKMAKALLDTESYVNGVFSAVKGGM